MYPDQNVNHIVLFLENRHKQTIESFIVGGKLERICTIFKLYCIKTWYCVRKKRNILRPYVEVFYIIIKSFWNRFSDEITKKKHFTFPLYLMTSVVNKCMLIKNKTCIDRVRLKHQT